MNDLTDDDRTSDILEFNPDPHKELREGHPELMDRGVDEPKLLKIFGRFLFLF